MFFGSVMGGYGETVFIPPPQAFPLWERPLLRLLSRQMVCRLHLGGRVISGGNTRLRYLDISVDRRLENGGCLTNRIGEIEKRPRSPLAKRLDAIIWEYLQLTEGAAKTISRLESQDWQGQNEAIQEQINLLRADLKSLGVEYAERIVDEINLHDRPLQSQRVFDQTVAKQLEQGKVRQLLNEAQMAHDDLTICRPAKSIATR